MTLFIGHANVGGAVTSSGQPNIGREIELSPRHLDRLGPIYKGLNHVHKAQEIHGAHYPGSICRLDWGEIETKVRQQTRRKRASRTCHHAADNKDNQEAM